MERIKKDLKEIIVKFVEDNDFHKPLMIIVRTNHGSSNPVVDDCRDWMVNNLKAFCFQGSPLHGHRYFVNNDKIERIADHPELLSQTLIPSGADKAHVLLYHRWLQQLEPQYLEYAVAISRTLQKPTVCLINDYEYDACEKEKLELSDFNVLFYNGDMSISYWKDWLDSISSKKELLPEIEEFVKNELETANDSTSSSESGPWIIASKLSPRLIEKIDTLLRIHIKCNKEGYISLSSMPRSKIIKCVWSVIGFNGKDEGERIADFVEEYYSATNQNT